MRADAPEEALDDKGILVGHLSEGQTAITGPSFLCQRELPQELVFPRLGTGLPGGRLPIVVLSRKSDCSDLCAANELPFRRPDEAS